MPPLPRPTLPARLPSGTCVTVLSLACSLAAHAGTFPAANLVAQTSGRAKAATSGDWYSSNGTASTDRVHRFLVEITPEQLAAAGGSLTITVEDAESTSNPSGPTDNSPSSDPTRVELRAADGVTVLQGQTIPSGSPNGTNVAFTVAAPGRYQVVSMTGAEPLGGSTAAFVNNDDNGIRISVPGSGGATGGQLGVLQGAFVRDIAGGIGATTYTLHFLVGPGPTSLQLRNFDLDNSGAVQYFRPDGGVQPGTRSGNGVWNGGGSLNAGGDTVAVNTLGGVAPDAGVWRLQLVSTALADQAVVEANDNQGLRLPLLDAEPLRAGLFTLDASGAAATPIGTPVDHPFTAANLFFTNDIVNFTLSGTAPNYAVQLLTGGGAPLGDSDGDGKPDTGVLAPGASAAFILRVTPLAGASSSDTTRINAVSFMDRKVGPGDETVRYIDKTTYLPPRLSMAFLPNPAAAGGTSRLSFTFSNVNATPTADATFANAYPAGLVNATSPTVVNGCGGTVNGGAAGGGGIGLSGATIPAHGSCTVSVDVSAATVGTYVNASGPLGSTNHGSGAAASATLEVIPTTPPSVTKSFAASPIPTGGTTALTLTLTNPNPGAALSGVAVNDIYPAGMANAAVPAPASDCPGGVLVGGAAGGNSVGVSGVTLAAGASCTVAVNVTAAAAGSHLNSTGAVTSSSGDPGNSAAATLAVHDAPSVALAFAPAAVNVDDRSTLTFTLANPNHAPLGDAAFSRVYPAGLVNAAPLDLATTCPGGVPSAAAGGNSVALAGGTLPASGSCTVTIAVRSAAVGAYNVALPAGGLATTNGIANAAPADATLTVQAVVPPTVAKSFSPSTISTNGVATMTLVVANPNPSRALSGVAVGDTYPGFNMRNMNPANPMLTCTPGSGGTRTGGSNNGNTLGFSGGTLLAGASCTLTVLVTGTAVGTYNNVTTAVSSSNGGTGATAAATLVVQAAPVPPHVTKAFDPVEIATGGTARLTLNIANPNNVALADIRVQDVYPAGMVNANPAVIVNGCGGNSTPNGDVFGGAVGGNTFGLQGNNNDLAARGSCSVSLYVTAATAGALVNTSGNVTSTTGGGLTGNAASATLAVAAVTAAQAFAPATLTGGGITTLTIAIDNPSAANLFALGFTDPFPTAPGPLTVAAPLTFSNDCGGTLTDQFGAALAPGASGIRLNGGALLSHSSCTITVAVTATASGVYVNAIPANGITSNAGTNPDPSTATLTVPLRPTLGKSFAPASIGAHGLSTLTLTLGNDNPFAATHAAVTDALPPGVITVGSPATDCAGGALASDATSLTLTGGTIPAGSPGTCTVAIDVTSATPGVHTNTVPAGGLTAATGDNATVATATLTVGGLPSITVTQNSSTVADPFNFGVNPKSIPGATKEYQLVVTNAGATAVDLDSLVVSGPIPAATVLFVGDLGAAGSGPVAFSDGPVTSALTYTFAALSAAGDDIEFSADGGTTWNYVPAPDVDGYDPNVTHVRIKPKGAFAAAAGGNPSFQLRYRVRVK